MEPLISVIIPVYNVKKYLRRCVESVIGQSYKNLEIILVDDGSPDGCFEICEQLKQEDERIVVLHKENGGLSDARNTGIDIARGEYIMFVDSDDYINSNMAESLYKRIKEEHSEMAIANFAFVDERDAVCKESANVVNEVWDKKRFWSEMYGGKHIFCVVAWNKLYRADLFKTIRFPKNRLHEDEFVIFDLINQCSKISVLEEKHYFYLQRANGIMGSEGVFGNLDSAEAFVRRALCFYEEKEQELAEQTLNHSIVYILNAYIDLEAGNKRQSKRYKYIKRMYNRAYWRLCGVHASIRFNINALTFLLGPKIYILTHYTKLKKKQFI